MRRSAAASAGRPPPAAEQLILRPSPLMPPTGVVARLLAVMQSPDWPTESAGCRAAFELSVPRDVRSSPASVVSADWCRGVRATPDTHLVGAGRRGSWQLSACAAGVPSKGEGTSSDAAVASHTFHHHHPSMLCESAEGGAGGALVGVPQRVCGRSTLRAAAALAVRAAAGGRGTPALESAPSACALPYARQPPPSYVVRSPRARSDHLAIRTFPS